MRDFLTLSSSPSLFLSLFVGDIVRLLRVDVCRYDVFRRGFSCTRVDWIMIFLPVNLIFGIFFFFYGKNYSEADIQSFVGKFLNLNIAISEIRRGCMDCWMCRGN